MQSRSVAFHESQFCHPSVWGERSRCQGGVLCITPIQTRSVRVLQGPNPWGVHELKIVLWYDRVRWEAWVYPRKYDPLHAKHGKRTGTIRFWYLLPWHITKKPVVDERNYFQMQQAFYRSAIEQDSKRLYLSRLCRLLSEAIRTVDHNIHAPHSDRVSQVWRRQVDSFWANVSLGTLKLGTVDTLEYELT